MVKENMADAKLTVVNFNATPKEIKLINNYMRQNNIQNRTDAVKGLVLTGIKQGIMPETEKGGRTKAATA